MLENGPLSLSMSEGRHFDGNGELEQVSVC